MLTPETVLQGRYRIVRQLGQGGMGTVFEAVDERLDTTVALKETLFTDERLRRQFEREARLLARLHHPALPRVSDHFSEGDGQFLVMQYIVGEDLAEMITRRRDPFPVNQVLSWADQLLDALDYLHTQDPQIIHRDIKPQNLKQTARGQIILLDFGLAKGQASEVSRVTTSASIFGYTPNYAPLEQVQGLGTDPRSDIYSLSATLYHLLTGTKPPDALTRAAAIINGQTDPLTPANDLNDTVSPEIAAVLHRA
ncbi:MAG: serine/threonine-protein kinase, partial [Pyrinomonadaceae bacterium]